MPRVVFLAHPAEKFTASRAGDLAVHMIWSEESVPVPVRQIGPATSIASSSWGHRSTPTPDLHTVFAKQFVLPETASTALIHLFCYTRYRLYINGIYQGRGPSRFQNQRPEYDTRSLTNVLRPGNNWVVVLVHRDGPTGRIMSHQPGFAASIEWGDKSRNDRVITDGSWLARPDLSFGVRNEAWASIEENIDARKGFQLTDTLPNVSDWRNAVPRGGKDFFPVWPRSTPLQCEIERPLRSDQNLPIALRTGEQVSFLLPEIAQAYTTLELEAQDGSALIVDYHLPEEQRNGSNSYVALEGVQTYMAGDTFTHNKFTVRILSGRAQLRRASATEVRYPFERVASFQSGDSFLNQLWTICARSLEILSEDSYVDCADRERAEWIDDSPPAFDCTRVMMRGPNENGLPFWSDNRLLKALLRRIALTQQADGQLKAHSCSERFDIHAIMEDRSCDWVVLVRQYYESSGDKELVRELWPVLLRLMAWYRQRRTDRGLVLAREWEVWDNPLRYQVCEGAGLNALAYRAMRDASVLAKAIAAPESASLADESAQLRAAFNSLLWNDREGAYDGALFGAGSKMNPQLNGHMFAGPIVDGRYHPTAQAALFALYAGIVPPDRIDAVRRWVLAHLDQIKGPMSHYYLFRMLYEMEDQESDSKVLEHMRTAWKYQVESPWKTTWESLTDDGGSKVHIYGASPGYFLSAYVLGVRRIGNVRAHSLLIEPRPGDLDQANGLVVTEFGPVEVAWSKDRRGIMHVACVIPKTVDATLRFYKVPHADSLLVNGERHNVTTRDHFVEYLLSSGTYEIRYPA